MDDDLKALVQDMKNYQTSMMELNENRLKTAKHMEAFAAKSPFEDVVSPPVLMDKAVTGTEAPVDSGSVASAASGESPAEEEKEATNEEEAEAKTEDEKEPEEAAEEKEPEDDTETEEKVEPAIASDETPEALTETEGVKEEVKPSIESPKLETKHDTDSFAGVHLLTYNLAKRHHDQYGNYLISYVEDWERVVSQRIHGLLIHYRELQENALHYNKKVGGLLHKVDKSKSVRHKLAEKLDRNEIKEMGAVEARDTVGEHLYLYIEEVMERAWRDVFPLLLRSCRFEADFCAATAGALANLVDVAANIQVLGEKEECVMMGRLDDLQKKHPEEVYTEENPFVKLTPRKTKAKEAEAVGSEGSSIVSDEAHGADPTSESQVENLEEV
jgi:hypothetical protein